MKALLAPALFALAACGASEPEPAANRFDRLENEIGAQANALNAQVENELSQAERRLDEEASAALNSLNATAAANSAEAGNEAAPAAPVQTRRR